MTPEEPSTYQPEAGVSRRRMLKRIGAGAAIAWTAPILTSIRTPAFAQYGCDCPPWSCTKQQLCDNGCPCAPHHGNGGPCVCWSSGICNAPGGGPICATDADCAFEGPTFVCGDIDPDCQCDGNVACLDTTGCTSSRRQRPIKGIRKA